MILFGPRATHSCIQVATRATSNERCHDQKSERITPTKMLLSVFFFSSRVLSAKFHESRFFSARSALLDSSFLSPRNAWNFFSARFARFDSPVLSQIPSPRFGAADRKIMFFDMIPNRLRPIDMASESPHRVAKHTNISFWKNRRFLGFSNFWSFCNNRLFLGFSIFWLTPHFQKLISQRPSTPSTIGTWFRDPVGMGNNVWGQKIQIGRRLGEKWFLQDLVSFFSPSFLPFLVQGGMLCDEKSSEFFLAVLKGPHVVTCGTQRINYERIVRPSKNLFESIIASWKNDRFWSVFRPHLMFENSVLCCQAPPRASECSSVVL